jgi:hypothetical protein
MPTFRRDLTVLVLGLVALFAGLLLAAIVSQSVGYAVALCGLVVTLIMVLRFTT